MSIELEFAIHEAFFVGEFLVLGYDARSRVWLWRAYGIL
jgi:hypothetical protein